MEVQITDFENAAFTVFVVLVTRVILAFDLNLYIPLSKVDENMRRAHKCNAVLTQRFFVRKHMAPPQGCEVPEGPGGDGPGYSPCAALPTPHSPLDGNVFEEMTLSEILEGKGHYFPGLIPLVLAYLDHIGCDRETRKVVENYLELIKLRGRGDLPTAAQWIRRFVDEHPEYQHDSVITQGVAFDLLQKVKDISLGQQPCPELLGKAEIDPICAQGAYDIPLASSKIEGSVRCQLIKRYVQRARDRTVSLTAAVAKADDITMPDLMSMTMLRSASVSVAHSETLGEDFIFNEL